MLTKIVHRTRDCVGIIAGVLYIDGPLGATENAGLENAVQENGGPNGRGGKRGTGKHGNIVCMGSDT